MVVRASAAKLTHLCYLCHLRVASLFHRLPVLKFLTSYRMSRSALRKVKHRLPGASLQAQGRYLPSRQASSSGAISTRRRGIGVPRVLGFTLREPLYVGMDFIN